MPHHGGAAMTRSNPFPSLLRAFFQEWLVEQRSASVHTIRSYRDTWRLLLRFIAERKGGGVARVALADIRSEEHTSELQSLMRTSYAVFCLKKKNSKAAKQSN